MEAVERRNRIVLSGTMAGCYKVVISYA